jgi:(S)-2-hydroxy-acid oxidase
LDVPIFGYFSSGADDELTLNHNRKAFADIKILPRVLVDMTNFSMSTKILGKEVSIPFGMAPVAMQKLIHPEGELLAAK